MATIALAAVGVTGCEDKTLDKAADLRVCTAKATKVSLPSGFPAFPFPRGTVVYHVQDRQAAGTVATGIVRGTIKSVLAQLNGPGQKAGYKITSGETEEHDAEANWTGHGYTGRWAIQESGSCTGEILIQVLASTS